MYYQFPEPIDRFLESIENSGLCIWVREANTPFAYPSVLALHTFGLILLVGFSSALAMRLLGMAPDTPVSPFKKFFPLVWIGLYLNLASGLVLLALDARTFLSSVDFYIKMATIVVAVRSLRILEREALGGSVNLDKGQPVPARFKTLSRIILFGWAIAITAGRLTAYDPFIQRQTSIAVIIFSVVILGGRWMLARMFGWDKTEAHTAR